MNMAHKMYGSFHFPSVIHRLWEKTVTPGKNCHEMSYVFFMKKFSFQIFVLQQIRAMVKDGAWMRQMVTDVNAHLVSLGQHVQMLTTAQQVHVRMEGPVLMRQVVTDVNAHLVSLEPHVQMWMNVMGIHVDLVELVWMVLNPSPVTAMKTTRDQIVS